MARIREAASPREQLRAIEQGVQSAILARTTTVSTVTASTAIPAFARVVLVNATSGAVTLTLPPAATATGVRLDIKKIDSSGNSVTVDGNGAETIDGAATLAWTTQYQSYTLCSDGSGWHII